MNSFFLSVRFPRTRREVLIKARRQGQACVHGSEYLIFVSFARFLPLPLVGYGVSLIFTASLRSSKNGSLAITLPRTFFIILFPTAFYRRSRMTGRYLIPFCKKTLLPFYSRLPLSSAPLTLSPTSGDSFQFVFFLLCTDLAVNIFMKKLRILLPLVVCFPGRGGKCQALRGDRACLCTQVRIVFQRFAHSCPFRRLFI